jgi:hypothetical protein
MPETEPIDGFEFCVTLNYDGDPDSIRPPRMFRDVVDMTMNQVLLRVHDGATGYWTVEVLFDRTSTPYLASGWRRFCQKDENKAGHFVVFNYDSDHMCCRHNVAPARGVVAATSSYEDDE